jgi:hypothetical protein
MDILIWKTFGTVSDRQGRKTVEPQKVRGERRISRRDRRRSVSEGLVVSLSIREEKRQNPDRRHSAAEEPHFPAQGTKGSLFDNNSV